MADVLNATDALCLKLLQNRIKEDKSVLGLQMLKGMTLGDIRHGFSTCIPKEVVKKDYILDKLIEQIKTEVNPLDTLTDIINDKINTNGFAFNKWYLIYQSAEECASELARQYIEVNDFKYPGCVEKARTLFLEEANKYKDASPEQQEILCKYLGDNNIRSLKMNEVISDAKELGISDVSGSKEKIVKRILEKAKYIKQIDLEKAYICNKCGLITTKLTTDMHCPSCLEGKLRQATEIKRLLKTTNDIDSVHTYLYINKKELKDIEDILKYSNDLNIVSTARPFAKNGVVKIERDDFPYIYDFEWTSVSDFKVNIYCESNNNLVLLYYASVELTISQDREGAIFSDYLGNTLKYGVTEYNRYNKGIVRTSYVDKDGKEDEDGSDNALIDFINKFLVCNIGFNYRVLTRDNTEHVQIDKTSKKKSTSDKKQKDSPRSVSRRVIYLDGIELYTYDKDVWNAVKNHRVIELNAWGVRSHVRHYKKTGKTIIIEAYTKGKERDKYKAEELLQKVKVEIRGDKNNY